MSLAAKHFRFFRECKECYSLKMVLLDLRGSYQKVTHTCQGGVWEWMGERRGKGHKCHGIDSVRYVENIQ